MRRKINYNKLGEVSTKLFEYTQSFKQKQKKLMRDIDKIQDGYRGKDAAILVERYKAYANSLEVYLIVIEQYARFFGWLSGNYRDTHGQAVNAIIAGGGELQSGTGLNDIEGTLGGDAIGGRYV